MSDHITYDPAYDTVAPDDFQAMLEVDRYGRRSDAFDEIIARTHDHFWDPMDPAYLDYATPFDMEGEYLIDPQRVPELNSAVRDQLDEGQCIRLANEVTRWTVSSFLHGEQAALSLSASLCAILLDPGAQEYAANQAREEARHVTAFGRYVGVRWGRPYPVGDGMAELLGELVSTPVVYKKLVGMQLLLEGLAMGAFGNMHAQTRDPLLQRLTQVVMTDEVFHHRFGRIWAERTIAKLSEDEHQTVETWTARCFEIILFNLVNIRQKRLVYEQFGLDWMWVRDAVRETFNDQVRRREMKEGSNTFRVLVKTLLGAGIITERTRHLYDSWIDMDELEAETDDMVGLAIATDGIEFLRDVNAARKPMVKRAV